VLPKPSRDSTRPKLPDPGIKVVVRVTSLIIFVLSLAAGQLLFKRVGLVLQNQPFFDGFLLAIRQPTLYAALTLYGFSTPLWIWILSRVPLSQAYPWVTAGMAVVPLLGWYAFGESVAPLFWLGFALILVGISITQYSSQ
jgi:multidrug transporter EmrE-like cation transporter